METIPPQPTVANPKINPGLVFLGGGFLIVWLGAHYLWSLMAMLGAAMANDSGRLSNTLHMTLTCSVLGGVALCAFAGIPAAMAFFWSGRRKRLWTIFAVMFVVGAAMQILAPALILRR